MWIAIMRNMAAARAGLLILHERNLICTRENSLKAAIVLSDDWSIIR